MRKIFLASALLLTACACKLVKDTSMDALDGDDITVIAISPCTGTPAAGIDMCRFKQGDLIQSSWIVVIPKGKKVKGGHAIARFKDLNHSFPAKHGFIEIDFATLYGSKTWDHDAHDGIVEILAIVEWEDASGVQRQSRALGEARVVVLHPDYDPMPIDSGRQVWSKDFKCRAQYSTAGRSAVECK